MPLEIRVGQRQFKKGDPREKINQVMLDGLFDVLQTQTRDIIPTPEVLQRLVNQMRAEMARELDRLVQTAASFVGTIEHPMWSFRAIQPFNPQKLAAGARPGPFPRSTPPLNVTWGGVVRGYGLKKERIQFFALTGALERSFPDEFASAIDNKLGGVLIQMPKASKFKPSKTQLKQVIGEFRIAIFPRAGATVARYALGNFRFDANSASQLERYVLGDTPTARKLTGRRGAHRPLMAPLLNFWVKYRIPRALSWKFADFQRRTFGGQRRRATGLSSQFEGT
jgi:hypothetical protein